jgi:hypothetical protein
MAALRKPAETCSSTPTSAKPKKGTPKTLTDLPEELLEKILKYLALHSNISHTSGDLKAFLAVSFTSQQFRRIVLPMNSTDQRKFKFWVDHVQLIGGEGHWTRSKAANAANADWDVTMRILYPKCNTTWPAGV